MNTLDQRMDALAKANEVRIANGQTLKAIAAAPQIDGIDAVIDILRSTDEDAPIGSWMRRRPAVSRCGC